jgi:vitamin B12/bleomycin/antimicrobial peptide transport system ATP-binding/permease protein
MMSFLVERQSDSFMNSFFEFVVYLLIFLTVYAISTYLQDRLGVLWREELTHHYLERYLDKKNYYFLEIHPTIDNPDQRISEDIHSFVNKSITIFFLIFDSFLQLFAYSVVLWEISRTLFFLALVLSLFANILGVAFFGKKLTSINKEKYELEANLRFSLIQLREQRESIALSHTEPQERESLLESFQLILNNTKQLILLKSGLLFFQLGSKNLFTIFPTLYLSGMYIAKEIPFGTIEQGGIAFVTLLYSLNVIIDQLQQITVLQADSKRLTELSEKLTRSATHSPKSFGSPESSNILLKIHQLHLFTPKGTPLFFIPDWEVSLKDRFLLSGENGSGKTTFLKILANLHTFYTGEIQIHPSYQPILIPQTRFFSQRSLLSQILPPALNLSPEELREIYFPLVNLDPLFLKKELSLSRNWNSLLSSGEKQKLALLSVFLLPKSVFFLDESTSSLDEASQILFYTNAINSSIPFHTVSHQSSLLQFHTRTCKIQNRHFFS